MAKIGPYFVSNTSGSATQRAAVRVKRDGVLLCEVITHHSNPLKWVRTRPQCPERRDMVAQLILNGVPPEDVKMILAMPKKEEA